MAYTEFYCNASTGSNVNGGSDPGTVTYTSTNGNWDGSSIYTPTDGSNPVTAGVKVGQFASVYIDAATVAVYIARVTAVTNAANGTITLSTTAHAGTAPTSSATARSIKVGGAWKGPNAAVNFPLAVSGTALQNATDSSTDGVRINFKNNASYSISSPIATTGFISNIVLQGYSSNPGDGGKATFDGSANAITIMTDNAQSDTWIDFIFSSSATSGLVNNFVAGGQNQTLLRVISHGARVSGIVTTTSSLLATLIECETYGCNLSNTASRGGTDIFSGTSVLLLRCISHDNVGNANSGFTSKITSTCFFNCVAFNNGQHGFAHLSGGGGVSVFENCDTYNNTGDGINIAADTLLDFLWIENCNLIKNGGKGINNTAATSQFTQGFVYNCGYGSGGQANTAGDSTLGGLIESGKVVYASGATPWNAPTTGDFSVVLSTAVGAGRGHFEENDGTHAGTIGFPSIGAAQPQPDEGIGALMGGLRPTT